MVLSVEAACARPSIRPDAVPARSPDARRDTIAPIAPERDDLTLALGAKALMVPVEGVTPERVPNTYNAKRSGGAHNALDILAPRGTPVLSADAGRILRLRTNPAGGITIYALDRQELFVYYYAHLERYRDGLTEGESLEAGDLIGYVGTTGNAPPNIPHLHFQVMRYRRDRYWDGEPINPHVFLARSGTRR
jgi:murein DD-endopeptidase MepM/ murein hydrolase activator NlpD